MNNSEVIGTNVERAVKPRPDTAANNTSAFVQGTDLNINEVRS